jgi:hypothetical protein
LALVGLSRADLDSEDIDVWPENMPVIRLFDAMRTQWRVGYGGAYGLDYNPLQSVMDWLGIEDRPYAFEGLRVMESVALDEMHKDK